MLTVVLTRIPDASWWMEVAAGFAAGLLAMALLVGQAWAWAERRRIDLVGAAGSYHPVGA